MGVPVLYAGSHYKPVPFVPIPVPVVPHFSAAEVGNVNASTVAVTFDTSVDAAGNDYSAGVTIKVNDAVRAFESGIRQSNHAIVYYALSTPVEAGDTVTWEYSQSSGHIVSEADATPLADVAAQSVTNNVSGDDYMQIIKNLTNDQIINLPTSAVEVIATPGANKLIAPFAIWLHLKNWVADYIGLDAEAIMSFKVGLNTSNDLRNNVGGNISLLLAGGGPDGVWAVASPAQLTGNATTTVTPNLDPHNHFLVADSGWYDSDIVNKPLTISIDNALAGNLTGGNAAQSLDVIVFYNIIDAA